MPHRLLVLSLTCALSACANDRAARREVVSLRRQVDQLRTKTIRDLRTIRELENRVFVLEDRLETEKVQAGKSDKAPQLPVVTRRPAESAPAPTPAPAPAPPAVPPAEEPVEIVYEGDALVTSSARPRLGRSDDWARVAEPPVRRARRGPLPDPAAVTDRIPVVPVPGAAPRKPGDDPASWYRDAYAALQRGDHAAATLAFERFLARWPAHDYADNAQYWLGEAYYDQRDYKVALGEFRKVIQSYPRGNKAPDALLKVGYCYANLGNASAARDVLSQVVDIYPRSDAARLAEKRLEELKR